MYPTERQQAADELDAIAAAREAREGAADALALLFRASAERRRELHREQLAQAGQLPLPGPDRRCEPVREFADDGREE